MMSLHPLSDYFQAVERQFATGQAGEHAYRPALKSLFESVETGLIAIIDFPRVPLTDDPDLFAALVQAGAALVDLHLMRSPALSHLVTTFPVPGEHVVERGYPKYVERERRMYINPTQYFEGVEPDVWALSNNGRVWAGITAKVVHPV